MRLALFIGYLLLVGQLRDIRRVFEYHGAEHKAIAAYENNVELTPETAAAVLDRARALRHQLPAHRDGRGGVRVLADPAAQPLVRHRVACRAHARDRRLELRGDPLLREEHAPPVGARASCRPGLLLQGLTTREPDLEELEVAIASLEAVFTAEQQVEVASRAGRLVPAIAPAV